MINGAGIRTGIVALALVAASLSSAAGDTSTTSLDSGLAACAAISAAPQRLTCYDALAGRAPPSPAAKAAVVDAPAVAPAAGSATTKGAVAADAAFGLKEAPPKQEPVSVTARIVSMAESLQGRVVVTLDNNQRWEFQGPDSALSNGDVVVITTASLGSFLMTTPVKRKLRVRRIR